MLAWVGLCAQEGMADWMLDATHAHTAMLLCCRFRAKGSRYLPEMVVSK